VQEITSLLSGKGSSFFEKTREITSLNKDKKEFPAQISLSSWQYSDKNHITAIVRDITQQKKNEKEKRLVEKQLFHMQKIKTIGTLAGGIAHEFNNTLAPVLGYAAMCLDLIPEADQTYDYVKRIEKSAKRARSLVKKILTYGRRDDCEKKPIKSDDVVHEAVTLIRSIVPATITIREHIASNPGFILADENQIHQVIVNLCTNGYQAMQENGGVLEVQLANTEIGNGNDGDPPNLDPGTYVKITIRDTGTGIPDNIQERIFDPFFTTKEVGKGTGMGLSVVHGIVTRHGGAIAVSSSPGEGSVFTIYLPKHNHINSVDGEKEEDSLPGSGRIMIVDDETEIVEMVKLMLERKGFEASTFTECAEALAVFRQSPHLFDLVITDYTMPNMTGAEFRKELLNIRADIRIILTTGGTLPIAEKDILSQGFQALIMKPLTAGELITIVQRVLGSQKK